MYSSECDVVLVHFHSAFSLSSHSVNGSLQFSSQEDFSEHLKKQTSTEDTDPEKKMKHVIPGRVYVCTYQYVMYM